MKGAHAVVSGIFSFAVGGVRVEIIGEYGHATSIRVACRRIARNALWFLHAAAPPEGTRCRVWLPSNHGEELCLSGTIALRRELFEEVSEMMLEFDEPLELQQLGRSELA